MARQRRRHDFEKRHHTERFITPGLVERWTNAKCAMIGFYLGQDITAFEIERILKDGTSAATVRRMKKLWGIPERRTRSGLAVVLTRPQRRKLERLAARKGVDPEIILDRICKAVLRDDLYEAVVDGDE